MQNIDAPRPVRPGEEIDLGSLEPYLRAHLPATEGAMSCAQFHGGHANLTYLIEFGEAEYVLRRPPFGKIAPGAHDMKREYRVLSKLYKHFPRAPRAFHLCEDETIIGSKFVVTERRHGVVLRGKIAPCFVDLPNVEQRLTEALVDMTADLHRVNVAAADLSDLGNPDGFAQRQVAGWTKRWQLSKTKEVPTMDKLAEILARDIPQPQAVSLVHNDIKFDNCQFQPDNPDEITALFDWDMTTTGDPLMDFGALLGYWPDAHLKQYDLGIVIKGDFPDKDFVKQKYAEKTGFDLSRIGWYEAFAYFKIAVIGQQLYQRFTLGSSTDERMKKFAFAAELFSKIALGKLRG